MIEEGDFEASGWLILTRFIILSKLQYVSPPVTSLLGIFEVQVIRKKRYLPLLSLLSVIGFNAALSNADDFIPRRQSAPPGPPLTPEQAIAKMTLPPGFRAELVTSEPDLQNPVAMAFDDRGRIYVTESFEYPRREPGPGRDKIKIFEDKDGDGRFETVKVFAEGLIQQLLALALF